MRARWQPSSGCRPKKSLGSSAGCKAGGSSIVHDGMEIALAGDTGRVSGRVPLGTDPMRNGAPVLLSRGTQGQRSCRRTARRFCGAPGPRGAR
jgi:hypothetical protein